MTPLSIEKESLGRPAMFQALILMGSPSVLLREKSSDDGIFLDYRDLGIVKKKQNKTIRDYIYHH